MSANRHPKLKKSTTPSEMQALQETVSRLEKENAAIQTRDRAMRSYIRKKTDQLLKVIGTLPLKPEELDDETLISVDPIGIVTESFEQVLEHLQETNADLSLANDEIQAIFDSAGVAIMLVDDQRRLQSYNRKSQELFFPDSPNMLGKTCCSRICNKTQPPQDCTFDQVIATQEMIENNNFVNDSRYYHAIGTPIKNTKGAITHVVLIYTDITEQKKAEERLRESEERFRQLYSTMREGVAQHRFIFDADGQPCDYEILDVNASYENILGFTREQVIGCTASELYPLINGKPACLVEYAEMFELNQSTNFELEVEFRGEARIFRISAAPTSSGCFASIFEDITQRKQDEKRIEQLAYYDNLTGLSNRILMRDRLCQMVARAKRGNHRIALFFLDLDHFKRINDTYGHDTGDQLLKLVAERLSEVLRNCDSICRLGGDEFVVLVDDIKGRDAAAMIACKMLEAMTHQIVLRGKEIYTSTSIGIGLFPDDGDDPDTLIKNSDTAMYRAKEEGRNTYRFYSADMNSKALEQLLLANDLRKALERNEFYLVFQPQIDLQHGQMTGIEALLRWQHADLGDIPPAQFIPLAEETGLILSIGEWVLENACEQTRKIQKSCGLPLRVAVNLSAKQFLDEELVLSVKNALAKTGLVASDMELEITESILMENIETAQRTLRELKSMGVKLAIDDFGTGYSSLSYLRNFPIDRLKVDKSFVQRITTHPDDAAITEAIIVMAHILGNRVVAEGVEQKTELDFLREKKCDEVQGFYFSRPQTADRLIEQILQLGPKQPFCFFNS